jgi:hypothetical protein
VIVEGLADEARKAGLIRLRGRGMADQFKIAERQVMVVVLGCCFLAACASDPPPATNANANGGTDGRMDAATEMPLGVWQDGGGSS